MVSFAHLSREERIGLGIAAAAHVALVAALVLQVRDDPTPLPVPERMDVSLASDVSLESTAPDPVAEAQAAVAPVLAPEPAPAPVPTAAPEPAPTRAQEEPQPKPQPTRAAPRPTPSPSPSARPTAQPSRQPEPKPAPSSTPGGSRIGADFLRGAGTAEGDQGTPAARAGPAEIASIQAAMARQIKPKWSAPQGVDAEKLVTYLSWDLNPDGSLKGRPRVERQSGITDSNRPQAQLHAERAIRAVQLAAPFNLPEEYYDIWKSPRNVKFDRNL